MSTLKINSFDNNDARVWVASLRLFTDATGMIAQELDAPADARIKALTAVSARVILAAAELVAALRGQPCSDLPELVSLWISEHPKVPSQFLANLAIKAVLKVKNSSELSELYDESGQTEEWHRFLSDLLRRLGASSNVITVKGEDSHKPRAQWTNGKGQAKPKTIDVFRLIERGWVEKLSAVISQDKGVVNAIGTKGNSQGMTLLYYALLNETETIMRLLVENGADVNLKSYGKAGGATPLHWAASKSNGRIVELLLVSGANVDKKADDGCTPLHRAAMTEYSPAIACLLNNIELLLAHGANVNVQDGLGDTPLHKAVKLKNTWAIPIIKLLLANEANVSLKNVNGMTPLDLVRNLKNVCQNDASTAELLLRGAQSTGLLPKN